ncbi:hypothetical protein GR160_08605 [Flavobacterium sp. Sd200]|uniref:hypothetical protein n=1 Tax=Flavobacterium sp. Sd200 TaxID=2692211 RepID=UPI00136E3D65|nr:hypothetical protein [Flavobacterium sp. Sd200]MXN91288.1 hypothetical protein [Flavobacterium sp. Sd200]
MSIIFSTPLSEDKLHMAYNNSVVRFYSDSTLQVSHATVGATGFSTTLYPAPNGSFYFNFKPYISALINTKNFEDTLQTALDRTNPNSFVYDCTDGALLESLVSFAIYFTDLSTDVITLLSPIWLAGVQQYGNNVHLDRFENHILFPFKKDTANSYYLKYWQGYPFDLSVYSPDTVFRLTNTTNLLGAQFDVPAKAFRLVLSDGDDDITLEDVLPLVQGFNTIRIKQQETDQDTDKFLLLEKVPYKQGVYLKWLNSLGGYSYWLFEDTYSIDRSTKQLGELDRDFYNLDDSFSRTIQIGKESQDTLKIVAELLNEDERRIVEELFDSPKIYLFTGKPFSQSDYRSWIEVSLKTTQARLKNPRQPLTNFTLDIELPGRFTQTL